LLLSAPSSIVKSLRGMASKGGKGLRSKSSIVRIVSFTGC